MTHPKHTHDDSAGDRLIDMKCTHCGYEEKMPAWCYGEEADYLIDIGNPEPPRWQCPKCYNETLCRKPQRLYTSPSSFNLIYFLSAFTSALLLICFLRFRELSYKINKRSSLSRRSFSKDLLQPCFQHIVIKISACAILIAIIFCDDIGDRKGIRCTTLQTYSYARYL